MRRNKGRPKVGDESCIIRPARVLRGDDEEQERRVDAPVVGELPLGQFGPGSRIEAMLVQDLPGLLLRLHVHGSSLEAREDAQSCGRDRRVEGEALPGGDQRVATEQRRIPGRACPKIAIGRPESIQVLVQSRTNRVRVHRTADRYPIACPEPRSNR